MINFLYLGLILLSILVSMTLHEAMHAFTSFWLGDDTAKISGRLTLNPLAHIDPFTTIALPLLLVVLGLPPFGAAKPVPFNPNKVRYGEFGAALVGLAGPLTNLLLACIAGLLVRLVGDNSIASLILQSFGLVNISFFVFNMIPFPPLDGSRALYALAPDSIRRFMEVLESMGIMALALFMLLFYTFLSDPFVRVVQWLMRVILGI